MSDQRLLKNGQRQLDPQAIQLSRRGLKLELRIDDCSYEQVAVLRTFPLTEPDRFWSLQSAEGQEIGVILDPRELSDAVRSLLQEELARRYFTPVIRRILAVSERRGDLEWSVETDRGPSVFTTHLLREVALQPVPFRYLISDLDGNRYDVHINNLDKRSRLLLMAYL